MKSRPVSRRSPPWSLVALTLALLAACVGGETPATEVLVVIESDLPVAGGDADAGLTKLRVRTFDPAGLRMLDERSIPLAPQGPPQGDGARLPFSFSIVPTAPGSTSTFRLVVTGLGPDADGQTVELVERQVLFTFRPRVLQEVRVFLAQGCVAQLCRGADALEAQTCDPETGTCTELAVAGSPQTAEPDAGQPSDSDAETGAPDSNVPEAVQDADVTEVEAGTDEPEAAIDGAMPMETIDVAEACAGNSDATVCADAKLVQCDEDGQVVAEETCKSARHCQMALTTGTCPVCLEGEHRCVEANLERCNAALEWETAETCATVALCNAEAKACTDAVCVAGSKTCMGDTLQGCNTSQTAFEAVETCMPGLCDPVASECDVCIPGVRACDGASAVRSCSADGQTSSVEPCGSARPKCTGDGVCVQCTETAECAAPSGECRAATCDVASGTCGSAVKAAHTKCSGGVCDGSGNCTGCIDGSDCSGSTGQCKSGSCVQCTTDSHCGGSAGECMAPSCNTSNATCGFAAKPSRTRCSAGVCDGSGNCVGCVTSGDCSGAKPACSNSGSCVECVTASDCGNAVDFACENNKCAEKAWCGNGVIERDRGEQCDDPSNVGRGSCTATCTLADIKRCYSAGNACGTGGFCLDATALSGFNHTCLPICDANTPCKRVVGWDVSCSGGTSGFCVLQQGCRSDSDCPQGLGCASAGSGRFCLVR